MKRIKVDKNLAKKKEKNYVLIGILMGVFTIIVVLAVVLFIRNEKYYRTHFIKGTIINDIDVSDMTMDELKQKISQYTLTIVERNKEGKLVEETITGGKIGLDLKSTKDIVEILENQKNGRWLFQKGEEIKISDFVDYNQEAWENSIDKLQCFSKEFVVSPTDAHISEYDKENNRYQIVAQNQGNLLIVTKAKKILADAIRQLDTKVDFEAYDCYEKPNKFADDETLTALLTRLNQYVSVAITYTFDDNVEVVDGDLLNDWLIIHEDNTVTLNADDVKEYVATLRRRYDTIFRPRTFLTSYDKEVSIKTGDYGWWMNYGQEATELYAMIEAGESGNRTPVYYQTAAQYGKQDYGDTYIEINLTAQHLFYYEDGELILESDFVSGNEARGHATPDGVFGITYKQKNATLVGENYKTPVSYWMPFNNHIGLHDATWRNKFGSDFYQVSGSHGCVNLPYAIAKELYGRISKGTPVICYNLKGTKSDTITEQSVEEIAQSVIDRIDDIGKVTKNSEKLIVRAREVYNRLKSEEKKLVTNIDVLLKAEKAFEQYKK